MNPIHKTKAAAIAALMALLPATVAGAEDAPKVVSRPNGEAFAKYYPERAQRMEVGGKVKIACVADQAGALQDCHILHEWPLEFGFGAAALRLASLFKLSGPGPYTTTIGFALARDETLRVDRLDGGQPPSQELAIITQPSDEEVAAAITWPGSRIEGVSLDCRITDDGRVASCQPWGKPSPAELDAALKLAARYRTEPPAKDFVGARTNIYFTFAPPDPDPPKEAK